MSAGATGGATGQTCGTAGRSTDVEGFHMYVHRDDVDSGALRPIVGRQMEIYAPKESTT